MKLVEVKNVFIQLFECEPHAEILKEEYNSLKYDYTKIEIANEVGFRMIRHIEAIRSKHKQEMGR